MVDRVAIAIGVARAGDLTTLPGAVNGARDFEKWAKEQDYKTYLLTDENGEVTTQQLKDLIQDVVTNDEPERLIVYFAGHGIQPVVNSAYWLLSNWEDDSDEAVNFSLSASNAKRSGIKQIAVFADACRATVPGASSVGGRSIFPKGKRSNRATQWDQFLATKLDDTAQEVPGPNPAAAYGIFSHCLMQALGGAAERALEERNGSSRVVTSGKLRTFLEEAVPLESGMTPGANVQYPDCSPGWANPDDVYTEVLPPGLTTRIVKHALETAAEAISGVTKSISDPLIILGGGGPDEPGPGRDEDRGRAGAARAVAVAGDREAAAVRADEELFSSAQGREGFETAQGLTIVGGVPLQAVVSQTQRVDLFEENGAPSIRGHGGHPQTVMIELENGNWIGACILPEFVGTIVVKDGAAVSVSYMPSRTSQRIPRAPFLETNPLIQRWTALMRQGRFVDRKGMKEVADSIRVEKHGNPSLGILAAYMYERAGVLSEIDSLAWYFADAQQPVPFDIAMLCNAPIEGAFANLTITPGAAVAVACSFPLMTQGWSLLDRRDVFVHGELPKIGRGLVPSLWTTLRPGEGHYLSDLVKAGEL